MADITNIDIDGLSGNEAAQPRVFAHSVNPITGVNIVAPIGESPIGQQVVETGIPTTGDSVSVLSRGACLYVGVSCNITVVMEGQPADTSLAKSVTFYGVTAGSFLPILVTKVWQVTSIAPAEAFTAADVDKRIIALF
jgi:hypothetical protein